MKFQFYLFVFSIFITGCKPTEKNKDENKTEAVEIKSPFKEEEVKWFKDKGTASIQGIAKFKSKGGVVRFGKEFRIELQPYSAYTKERLSHIYKNKNGDFVYIEDGVPKFTPDPKGYHDTKKTMCNSEGEFEYKDLPAGTYYVIAFMLWDETGGGIMRRVELIEGENKVIEMKNFEE
ncbi:hypothetical protein [Tenacibaculum agarivorans]|uniref:hypothetical protein n=1 Tax=Tenacibaculum agarivorans TaxID=1908389 RepID=UPI00094BBA7D|nr:hypothetical protein [Tenacibaculum agarivorans]